jgi:hypothetical protein
MGRPLKIQKFSLNTGVGSPGANTPVDLAYPPFSALTNPAYNEPTQTLDSAQFLGMVGGSPPTSQPSATYPVVTAFVNITLANGSSTFALAGSYAGRIIRQKGSHKYLVAYTGGTTADGAFIVGQAYQIVALGSTNWQSVGTGTGTVAAGDIFTATAASGGGNGTAYPVGVCVLTNDTTPATGLMAIGYESGDSAAATASNLKNKWVRDWVGTAGDYSDANLGEVEYTSENYYVANFFTDEGGVAQSGIEVDTATESVSGAPAGFIPLAVINNATS